MRYLIPALLAACTCTGPLHAAVPETKVPKDDGLQKSMAKALALPNHITPYLDVKKVYDHRSAADGLGLTAAEAQKLASMGIALAHCPGDYDLYKGLEALAEERGGDYSITFNRRPTPQAYRKGAIGRHLAGRRGKPETRIADFVDTLTTRDMASDVDLALLGMNHGDISDGQTVEYTTTVYRTRLDVRSYTVGLSDVFTENISTGTNVNGLTGITNFPLQLPNTEVAGVSTSVVVPSGGGTRVARRISPRYPGVAFAFYRDAMEALEKAYPQMMVAWSTVPLKSRDNLQRNLFNTMVRDHVKAEGKLLYDVAAILSHDEMGHMQQDRQGPVLASTYISQDSNNKLNKEGQKKLAQVWWAMMRDVQ